MRLPPDAYPRQELVAPRVMGADDRPAVHRVLPLSLTFDHPVVSGGEAGRFLLAVIADLERAD